MSDRSHRDLSMAEGYVETEEDNDGDDDYDGLSEEEVGVVRFYEIFESPGGCCTYHACPPFSPQPGAYGVDVQVARSLTWLLQGNTSST
jgi:hypothetical protein